MRILACADLHGDHWTYVWLTELVKSEKPDVLVMAGDLLSSPPGFPSVEEAQRADAAEVRRVLEGLGMLTLYIMGNDDLVELESEDAKIRSIHGRRQDIGLYNFVGYQHSLPFMGGVHEKPESEIRDDLESLSDMVDTNTVLVTHSPAFGILDTGVTNHHVGSASIRALVDDKQPIAHIHGHIHEGFGQHRKHFNVAAGGKKRAMLIELPGVTARTLKE